MRRLSARWIATLAIALLGLSSSSGCSTPPPPGHLEIVLLEADDCGACNLYRSFHDGAYPTQLAGYPGQGSIPVRVERKSALSDALRNQLRPHEFWSQSLSVAVLRDGKLLHLANIAEASDVARARFPAAIMAPASKADHLRAIEPGHFYGEYFKATWQLNYFVDVALGKRPRNPSLRESMLGEAGTLPGVAPRNLILWGSAGTPFANSLYIAERMQQVRTRLQPDDHRVAPNTVMLYGNGSDPTRDTSTVLDGQLAYGQSGIDTPYSPDAPTLAGLFHSLQGTQRNLIVQIGHSGPTGAPLWGQLANLDAPLLESLLAATHSDTVMVSGACHSGQFAKAPSCGFFAARPEIVASGCQRTPEALRHSDDYLRHYFDSLRERSADLDGDGAVSFSEAHWVAAVSQEDHQIAYDSLDPHVDLWWQQHAVSLPAQISFAELRALARSSGDAGERWAVEHFASRVPATQMIGTRDALARNALAMTRLTKLGEAPSAQRNRAMAMDYPLVLTALARRLLWRSRHTLNTSQRAIEACGARAVSGFLAN